MDVLPARRKERIRAGISPHPLFCCFQIPPGLTSTKKKKLCPFTTKRAKPLLPVLLMVVVVVVMAGWLVVSAARGCTEISKKTRHGYP